MSIKRKIEENNNDSEKKTKLNQTFSNEIFIKNLKDPESSFLALSEFNEYVRHLSSEENLNEFMEKFLQDIKFNLDDILALITEEKRKASENITLYRFLTILMEYFSRKNYSTLSEFVIKRFISINNSIHTIYFMLSSHSTASHLKITIRFLLSLVQQNEFNTRLIFSLIDFKRSCWKPLFKRRDIRDKEDVRYLVIKFFLSPLIYQNIDTIRNLMKEHDIFHEIFHGLMNDSRSMVEFILNEIRTNIIMLSGITKTDKIHLFDDRNLKSLIRLYNWTGEQKQKDKIKNKKLEESVDFDEQMKIEDNDDRNEVRKIIHTFMMIILNSKNYGIHFFDSNFGTSTKNSNPIIFKVIINLSNHFLTDEYAANLIVTCLTICPDLLQSFFKMITHEYISIHSKNLSGILEFLCEILQQQKSLETWIEIFQTITDSIKLTDIFINLTIPIDIMTKFNQIILKNSDLNIQLVTMKFLSMILERVKQALNILNNISLACDKISALEAYQQAILRYIPKPDHFCDSLNLLKTVDSTSDLSQSIGEYINLLKLYSSSCFMSMSAMNINLDIFLSNSVLNLLRFFKDIVLNDDLIENYFQCIRNILNYRESIDDVIWARYNKELECTPIRMLFQLGKQFQNSNQISEYLSGIIIKLSSIINNHYQELIIWFYTWLKLGYQQTIEQFLANLIEKIILNPYPLLEKTIKDTGYSLMIYSALDTIQHAKEAISNEIDEYLCHVIFQIYLEQINRSSDKIHQYLKKIYLKDRKQMKIYQLLNIISLPNKQNEILMNEINNIEQCILSNIDLQKGPDNIQINLAIKLNIFKIFSLNESDISRLVAEMIQCLNIVLLLHDTHRSFEVLFDTTIEYIQSYSLTIDDNRQISLICQLINGLNISDQTSKSLKNSKILLKCLEYEPNNYRLIYFLSNYLSREYRIEFLNIICQTVTNNLDILKIILHEIKFHKDIYDERFLDPIIDNLKNFSDNFIEESILCIMELIERMNKISNHNWKNILRLKQKIIFKLANKEYSQIQTRILLAKFIVQTIMALRSNDRHNAIHRLIHKSNHSLLLHAYIYYDLLNLEETIESEEFYSYLQNLLDKYSSESIVFDLFQIYYQHNLHQQDKLLELLQNKDQQENLPIKQTNQLLFILKLFPDSLSIIEQIYKSIIKNATIFFQSSNENNQNIDEWLISFEQCTTRLLTQAKIQIDLYELIKNILKYFTIFTMNSMNLLKVLIQFFVSQETFDQKYLSKLFANILKHKNFLEQLSSSNRWILIDILSLFVLHYNTIESSIKIDCSKHFPMLLSIYHPTLSKNDQHTLACMYTYEKQGYSMKSAFIWGETALKFYSTTIDTKNILLQASKLEQIMNLLDDRMMKKSILFYPVTRRLRTIEPQIYEEGDEIYDPAYLIPVFYHSLASECVVKCQEFVEKHCLAYCLMALSSRCGLLRAVVYNCLYRFEQHLLSQRFYCKEQILTMLTLLKQSIKKSNLKLAPIVALFLSKLVDLFTHPEAKIYRTITRFLLKQPYIDLVHIPLFGELFHSSSIEYKSERGWILNLLKYGIKDSIDYTLCTKAYVFKTLMTFYDCSLCDDSTKIEILNIFHSTSKLQDILMSLLFDYGFLLWLQMIVKNCSSESLMVLSLIIQNIGLKLLSVDNQVQLLEFSCLLMLFIRRLNNEPTITSSIADVVVTTLMKYQESKSFFGDIKRIVDCSTITKKTSLLSCFC